MTMGDNNHGKYMAPYSGMVCHYINRDFTQVSRQIYSCIDLYADLKKYILHKPPLSCRP